MSADSEQLSPVEQLAEEFLERQQRGEKPTIGEYCDKYPELADEIRDVFEALAMMEELKPDSHDVTGTFGTGIRSEGKRLDRVGDYRILREIGRGGMGVVYEAEQESLRRRVALKVLPRRVAGDDKALHRFQREARAAARMHHTNIVPVFDVGEDDDHVFYAMQMIHGQGLDLVIDDLKRLRTEHVVLRKEGPAERSRARREIEERQSLAASLVTGRFHQENLVAEVRREETVGDNARASAAIDASPRPDAYAETVLQGSGSTASAMLPGQSQLSTAETNRRAYYRSVAEIGLQTARALSYAHARGIIHRDIKPSNLLLDAAGVVWVTDFGLAKTSDESMTHTGDILGTIRYMSPERFKGQCDVRADVYSLGLTLYELLVLRPAFSSPDRLRLIEMVSGSEPPAPRSLDPRIPRDLETIVLKSIDKDPRRRYQSGDELCEDLERFIQDEPIKARRVSLSERLVRWSRRNRGLAASLAVVCGLLVIINIAGPLMYWRMAELKQEADQGWEEAEKKKHDAEQKNLQLAASQKSLKDTVNNLEKTQRTLQGTLDEVTLAAAEQALTTPGKYFRGKELLNELRPRIGEEDHRGIEFHLLNSLPDTGGGRVLFRNASSYRTNPSFSPDGQHVAILDDSNNILILDVETGTVVKRLVGHTNQVTKIRWFAGGTRVVSCEWNDSIRVWDAESGLELLSMPGGKDVALSPEETRLVTVFNNGALQIRDIGTGELLETFEQAAVGSIWGVDWSSRNELAFCGRDGVYLRDLATGETRTLIDSSDRNTNRGMFITISFSPDGNQLAVGNWSSVEHPALVWDLQHTAEPVALPFMGGVSRIAWNNTGTLLAIASFQSKMVEIWDPATGQSVRRFTGHSGGVGGCSWSPDDRRVMSTSMDQTVRIWDVEQQNRVPESVGHQGTVRGLTWSPDNRYIATTGDDGTVRIWDVATRKELYAYAGHKGQFVYGVDWNRRDNRLVSWDGTGRILVWNWDGTSAVDVQEVPDHSAGNYWVSDVVWSPDGTQIAVATRTRVSAGGFVRTYACEANRMERQHEFSQSMPNSLSWCRNRAGNDLLAVTSDEAVQVWNVQTHEELRTHTGSAGYYDGVAFSPLGDRVAFCGQASGVAFDYAAGTEPVLGILDLETGDVLRLRGHEGSTNSIDWTHDGTRLLTASEDGTAILWDAVTGRQLVSFEAPDRLALQVAQFSPDELQIAIPSLKGGIQLLDATPSYVEEFSEKLLPRLDLRIADKPMAEDLVLRGRIRARQGKWDDARDDFDRAARLGTEIGTPPSWFETCWWVAGPFPKQLADQPPLAEHPFDPQQPISAGIEGEEGRRWSAAQVTTALDLGRLLAHKEHTSAYALRRIYSTKLQTVGLLLGADDQVRVWLQGKTQYTRAEDRIAIRDDEVIEITLRPGWNDLLFQVTNSAGAHGLFARLSEDPRELAQAFERNEQWQQALDWSDRGFARNPRDVSILFIQARAALKLQQWNIAEESFRRVIEAASSAETTRRRIAALYLEDAQAGTGQFAEGTPSLKRARELYEAFVQSKSPNVGDAAGLADVLLTEASQATWTVLAPDKMKSTGGATLTKLADESILASGINPKSDTYELDLHPKLKSVTAVRLEALTSPSLPRRGPGRGRYGNFAIEQWTWEVSVGDAGFNTVEFDQAAADHANRNYPITVKGWNIAGGEGHSHEAVFHLETPVQGESVRFRIKMPFQKDARVADENLGRFRISATGAADGFEREAQRLAIQKFSDGWEQLAAAYHLRGMEPELKALVVQRPEAGLGVARYLAKKGRREEALDIMSKIDSPADKLAFLQSRGELYLQFHKLEQAADDYFEIVQLDPQDSFHWLKAAPLLVAVGDVDRYRQLCKDALQRFAVSKNVGETERIIKICSILKSDDSLQIPTAKLTDEMKEMAGYQTHVWSIMATVLSEYRRGKYDDAILLGDKCLSVSEKNEAKLSAFRNMKAFGHLIQAMSYHQLGDSRAMEAFQKGAETCKSGLPESPDIGWWDTFISQALLREADALIHGK